MNYADYRQEKMAEIEEAKKAEGKEFKENSEKWKVGRNFLKEQIHIKEVADTIPSDILDALLDVYPARKTSGGGASSVKSKIRTALFDKLREDGEVSETEVFMLTMKLGQGWGRVEMKNLIKRQIMWVKPEERLWIEYVEGETEGTYKLVAEGAEAPEDWEGDLPKENEMEDLV